MNLTDKISEHFTYGEVIKSNVAEKMQLDNSLPLELLPKVKFIAENILEKVRAEFKKPILITSWWRCSALNQMISNNPESQYTKAEAVDFVISTVPNITVAEFIRDNLTFDQLLLERNWIHCSLKYENNRKEVLRTHDGNFFQKGLKSE